MNFVMIMTLFYHKLLHVLFHFFERDIIFLLLEIYSCASSCSILTVHPEHGVYLGIGFFRNCACSITRPCTGSVMTLLDL